MKWQVTHALDNIAKDWRESKAEHVDGEFIKILTTDRPNVLAAISEAEVINEALARHYNTEQPALDFLCGYRRSCVWEGGAISYLEDNNIGWGNFGTLWSATADGNANTATHKVYAFSDRLIRQCSLVAELERQYDRVYKIVLRNGKSLRMGMIADYEPTADAIRTLWQRFGPVDIVWNINPNGNPTKSALAAGAELGCKVIKWDEFKEFMKGR